MCGESNPHGLRLRSRIEAGRVVLDYTTREEDLGWRHIVHGGITATLLDEVMTWAAIVAAGRACVAAELTTRIRRPIAAGARLRVEGAVSGGRGRLLMTEGLVKDPAGLILAEASGKYMPMAADQVGLCEADFVASPEAIPLARLLGGAGAPAQ